MTINTTPTEAELDALTPEQERVLDRATQRLANEMQRQAAAYQRFADRLRKRARRRERAGR